MCCSSSSSAFSANPGAHPTSLPFASPYTYTHPSSITRNPASTSHGACRPELPWLGRCTISLLSSALAPTLYTLSCPSRLQPSLPPAANNPLLHKSERAPISLPLASPSLKDLFSLFLVPLSLCPSVPLSPSLLLLFRSLHFSGAVSLASALSREPAGIYEALFCLALCV